MFQKGFTLIELLVVVAIIGVLAAVGVLAFQGFLKNSKDKKIILENLKLSKNFTIFNHYKKFSKYLSQ